MSMLFWISALLITTVYGHEHLKCFHCLNVTHTYECLQIEDCGANYEACYLQVNNENGLTTYSQGCLPQQFCSGGSQLVGRSLERKNEAELTCCGTDFCNRMDSEVSGLMFKISTYIGDFDVQEAWMTGKGTVSDDYCRNVHPHGCTHHYRHPAVDNWAHIRKDVIKYALYKNEVEVAAVWFNGTGSTLTDWFSDSRIINSTWTDLRPGSTAQTHIAESDPSNWLLGRQFMLLKSYNGCPDDNGWSVIISKKADICVYDKYGLKTPYILYSRLQTYGYYPVDPSYTNLGDFDLADAAAVYIYNRN